MRLGDTVRSVVALPGIPAGTAGTVTEIGSPFIAVQFGDGRVGYYARRQLRSQLATADPDLPSEISLGFTPEVLPAGSHLCCLPATGAEMLSTCFGYLAAGLRAGERCFCFASPRWAATVRRLFATDGHRHWLDSGDLSFVDVRDIYLPPAEFTADKQLARAERALASATGRTRVFGRPGACYREAPAEEWWDYEMRMTRVLGEMGASAICAYDPTEQRRGGARQAELTHPFVVRNREIVPGSASYV